MIYLLFSSVIVAVLAFLSAQTTYLINGQVQDNTGNPARGVRVCALSEECSLDKPNVVIPCAFSDSQGNFTITANKAGKYKIVYDDTANGRWATHLPFFRDASASVPEVILSDENAQASIMISMLPKNGLLVGKSVDSQTGLPVDNVQFTLCHAANPEICWKTSAKESRGNFTVPAPHVPFTFLIKANGFEDWLGPNGEGKQTPITVAPETNAQLSVFLKRSEATKRSTISETEKVAGVNLAAPAQVSPANDAVFNHYPRETRLTWSPVERSSFILYRVGLLRWVPQKNLRRSSAAQAAV